jgi:predicted dehydrogenase
VRRADQRRLRLGFAGIGWIGLDRMQAVLAAEVADVVVGCEPDESCRAKVREAIPDVTLVDHYDDLLDRGLDGIVIATPSALHAAQSRAALETGHAVFCQKPIARNAAEAAALVETARVADRRLDCDLSYRYTEAVQRVRSRLLEGSIGRPFALELVFHNAYGPDKAWYYDRALSGGGCVMDLGIHLVDLALWFLDFPPVTSIQSRLFSGGAPLAPGGIEDFAEVQLTLGDGVVARIGCSWRVNAGRDAVIEARVYGTEGGLGIRNLAGSFYDFVAESYRGTTTEILAEPPDRWGGRALVTWCRELARSHEFDPRAAELVATACVLDAIYEGGAG